VFWEACAFGNFGSDSGLKKLKRVLGGMPGTLGLSHVCDRCRVVPMSCSSHLHIPCRIQELRNFGSFDGVDAGLVA
jgi:hypothetical protein